MTDPFSTEHLARAIEQHVVPNNPAADVRHLVTILRSHVVHVARYSRDLSSDKPGAPRQRNLRAISATAAKLLGQLDRIGVTAAGEAMHHGAVRLAEVRQTATAADSPATDWVEELTMTTRLDALRRHHQLRALLEAIKAGFLSVAEQEPVSRGGRAERADPIAFGVEGLAAFWEAHAGRRVDMSRTNGHFLAFATDVEVCT